MVAKSGYRVASIGRAQSGYRRKTGGSGGGIGRPVFTQQPAFLGSFLLNDLVIFSLGMTSDPAAVLTVESFLVNGVSRLSKVSGNTFNSIGEPVATIAMRVLASGAGGSTLSDWIMGTLAADGIGPGIDLSGWRFQTPVLDPSTGFAWTDTDLSDYSPPILVADSGDLVICVPTDGVTTSGSSYARGEFLGLIERASDVPSQFKPVMSVDQLASGERMVVTQIFETNAGNAAAKIEVTAGTPGNSDGILKLKYRPVENGVEQSVTLLSNLAVDAFGRMPIPPVRIKRYNDKLQLFIGANADGGTPDYETPAGAFTRGAGGSPYYWKYAAYPQIDHTLPRQNVVLRVKPGTMPASQDIVAVGAPVQVSLMPYLKAVVGESFSYNIAQHFTGADDFSVDPATPLQAGLTLSGGGMLTGPASAAAMNNMVTIRATNLLSGLSVTGSVKVSAAQRPPRDIPAPIITQVGADTFRVARPLPTGNVPEIAAYDIRYNATLPLNASSLHRYNGFTGLTAAQSDFSGFAPLTTMYFTFRGWCDWGDGTKLYPVSDTQKPFSTNYAQFQLSAGSPSAPVFSVNPSITGSGKMGDPHTINFGADNGTSRNGTISIDGGAPVVVSNGDTLTIAPAPAPVSVVVNVIASGPGGSTSASASISMTLKAPVSGSTISNAILTQNSAASIATAGGFSGSYMTYSLAPASAALPAGLNLDPATGVISGTPTAAAAAVTIVVRATNDGGFFDQAFQITVQAAASTGSTMTANGMTATLASAVQVGTYVNGDPWAVFPATVNSFSIPSAGDRHGAEWNPAAGIVGFGATRKNGWDNRIKYQSDNATDPAQYDPALNIDPGKTGTPRVVSSAGVILKAQSTTATVDPDGNNQRGAGAVQRYTPFTFVAAAPPAGRFRPPVRGGSLVDATGWTLAAMQSRMSIFRSDIDLSNATLYPDHTASARATRLASISQFQYSGICPYWSHLDTHHSRDGLFGYGRNFTNVLGLAMLDLHSTIPAAEKEQIAIAICQMGIDIYGAVADGAEWQDNGGWSQGRMAAVLFAGLLFNDTMMLNAVRDPITLPIRTGYTPGKPLFAEQKTYHFVSSGPRSDGGNPSWGVWVGSGGAVNSSGRVKRVVIPAEMLGYPEWGIAPYRDTTANCAHPSQSYRSINLGSQINEAAAISMLNTAVDLTPLAAYLGSVDRGVRQANAAWTGVYNEDDPTRFAINNAMMTRGEFDKAKAALYLTLPFSRTRWTGKPEMAMPPDISITGTTVTVTCHPYEIANGEAITRRDLRYSQDGGATWTTIQGINTVHTFGAPLATTQIAVQVRLVSASGPGPWSTNQPNADASTNSGQPATVIGPRATGTTGTASGVTQPLSITDTLPSDGYIFDAADMTNAVAIIRGKGTTGNQIQVRGESAGGNTAWATTTVDVLGDWVAQIPGLADDGKWYTTAARIGTNDATRVTMTAKTWGFGTVVVFFGQSELEHFLSRRSAYSQMTYPALRAQNITVLNLDFNDNAGNPIWTRVTNAAANVVNVGLVALANALDYILPGRKLGVGDAAESGTSRGGLMSVADDANVSGTPRKWPDTQAIYDLWRAGGGDIGTQIECWYNSDAATIDNFATEWSPFYIGQRAGGGAFTIGTPNPDSTRNPGMTVDFCLWDITTTDPMTKGRGAHARGRTKAWFMTPMPFHDTDTVAEQRNYNCDSTGAFLNNRINQLDRPARDVMHALASDPRYQTFLRGAGVGFSAHVVDFGGSIHPLTDSKWGVPQFALQFLPAVLNACGMAVKEPKIIGTETAPDGSYTDFIVDLPNNGNLTTTRIKAGVALPSPQPPHYQTVIGFEVRRVGDTDNQRRPVFKTTETTYPAAYRGTVTIQDTGTGVAPNRTGKIRVTWTNPVANGDIAEFGRGEVNGHLLEPRDVTAQLFLDFPIEHVPAWYDATQIYPYYGVPVRPQPAAMTLTRTVGPDTTAPVISAATGAKTGTNTASGGFTTDEAGTAYRVTIPAAGAVPTAAQIMAGQDAAGVAANSGSVAVSAPGAVVLNATGLTPGTAYKHCFVQKDAANNISNVISSSAFTTDAVPGTPIADPVQSWVFKISGTANVAAGATISNSITIPAGVTNPLLIVTLSTNDETNAAVNSIAATWAGASVTSLDGTGTGEAASRMALRTYAITGITAGAAAFAFTAASALRAWHLQIDLFAGADQSTPIEAFDTGSSTSNTSGTTLNFTAAPSKAGCRAQASLAVLPLCENIDFAGSLAETFYDSTGTTAASDITVGKAALNDAPTGAVPSVTFQFKDGTGAAKIINGYARHYYYIRPA